MNKGPVYVCIAIKPIPRFYKHFALHIKTDSKKIYIF